MKEDWSSLLRDDLERLFRSDGDRDRPSTSMEEGERRDIAALFLDFRGFTELSEKMDHESVHMITGGIMKALAAIVEQHEGYVDKFEGDRIMALFGARSATENDSVRAVACGLRMLETMEEINGSLSERGMSISAGIGIASGRATVGPDPSGHVTATGSCVNLASRLEEEAPGNTLLVSEDVVDNCEGNFEWRSMGQLKLKGIESPVSVFTPTGPGTAQRNRWERTALLKTSSLVGREEEMFELERIWRLQDELEDRNRRGGSIHIFAGLIGDGGIGKSRLMYEFLNGKCRNEECLVLTGATAPFAQPPMTLWTSILRNLTGIRAGDPDGPSILSSFIENQTAGCDHGPAELMRNAEPYLASLLSMDMESGIPDEQDSEKRFSETLQALRNLILVLCSRYRRVVLALEDLHWVDPSSSKALSFLLGNCDTTRPILVLSTYRPGGAWTMPSQEDPLSNYIMSFRYELQGLSEDCCSALLTSMTGGRSLPSGSSRDFFLRRSQGNPFYLEELFLLSVETGMVSIEDEEVRISTDLESLPVPSTVSGLVQHRMDRLPADLRRTLQAASVLGPEFPELLFENYHSRLYPDKSSKGLLDELVRMRMLSRETGISEESIRFNHIMTRNAAYDTLLLYNRRIMHREAAAAFLQTYSESPEPFCSVISHHFEMGGVPEEAYRWGMKALELAQRNYQLEDILEWSQRLIEWIEEGHVVDRMTELLDLMLRRQHALNRLGRRSEQEELLRRMVQLASDSGLDDWESAAHNNLGILYRLTGRFSEAMDELTEAREIARHLPERTNEIGSVTSRALLHLVRNELDDAQVCLEEALEMAMDADDRKNEAYILGNLGILCRRKGNLEDSFEFHQRAMKVFDEAGDLRNVGANLTSLAILHFMQGSTEKAEDYFMRSLKISRKVGDSWFESKALANLGVFFKDTNTPERVEEYLLPALDIAVKNGERSQECGILSTLAEFHMENRNLDKAIHYAERGTVLAEELGDRLREGHLLQTTGEIRVRKHSPERALESLSRALEISHEIGEHHVEQLNLLLQGIACAELGRLTEARDLLGRAEESAGPSGQDDGKWNSYRDMLMQMLEEDDTKKD